MKYFIYNANSILISSDSDINSDLIQVLSSLKSKIEIGSNELMKDVQPEDLLRFGLIPEFIGRLPIISTLEDLDEENLIKILSEPKNSLTKQYYKLFEIEGVKLTFAKDALKAVAQKCFFVFKIAPAKAVSEINNK